MMVARVGRRVPSTSPRLRIRRLGLRLVLAAVVVPLWFTYLAPRPLGGPTSLVWVSGFSMEPTLSTGDLVILYRHDEYEIGDIVAFDIPEGGTVIHRVIDKRSDGYVFQGDNREQIDPWVLDEHAIRGRQLVAVPRAAAAMGTLRRPEIMAGLVAAMVLLLTIDTGARTPRRQR